MKMIILVTKWNGEEYLLRFDTKNKLIYNKEQFTKGMDIKKVIGYIIDSISNNNREFRIFETMSIMS